MNDMHDMTEHTQAMKADGSAHAHEKLVEVAHDAVVQSEAKPDQSDQNRKPAVVQVLDPHTERTKDAWHDLKASANNLFQTARYHSIRALPAAVVNNSTNILGVTHVMTEMLMLKASGDQTPLITNYKNPLRWFYDPIHAVFSGTIKLSKPQEVNDKSLLPQTGSAIEDRYQLIADTKLATQRELDRLEKKQLGDFSDRRFIELNKALDKQKKVPVKKKEDVTNNRLTAEQKLVKAEVDNKIDILSSEKSKSKIRADFTERLGFEEGFGPNKEGFAFKKDQYKAALTKELDGLGKNARADKVKGYETQLKEISGGTAYSQMRLSNPWQMRSTLAGLVVWALSAVWPDKKETDDEVERMAVLRSTNLPGYIGERFKQAIWLPEWSSHKRQMIGLGIMTSGVCSLIGSWRNRKTLLTDAEAVVELAELVAKKGLLKEGATSSLDKLASFAEKKKTARYEYEFNPSYFATSMLTFLSSLPLLFASDNERGFSAFGGLMTGRLLFLPSSIGKKFRDKEPGVGYYTSGMASFQAENWAQALAGGAQKIKDPTTGEEKIVDHDADRKAAAHRSAEIREHKGNSKDKETPSLKVTHVKQRAMAMPELIAAHEQQKAGVAV